MSEKDRCVFFKCMVAPHPRGLLGKRKNLDGGPRPVQVWQWRGCWALLSCDLPVVYTHLLWGGSPGVHSGEARMHRAPPFIKGSSVLSWRRTQQGWVAGPGWDAKLDSEPLGSQGKKGNGLNCTGIYFLLKGSIHIYLERDFFFHDTRKHIFYESLHEGLWETSGTFELFFFNYGFTKDL